MRITYEDGSVFDASKGQLYYPPQLIAFNVSRSQASPGDTVVVTWETANADQVTLNGKTVKPTGRKEFEVINPHSFHLVVANEIGRVEEQFFVSMIPGPPTVLDFNCRPTVSSGNRPIEISWDVGYADEVWFEGERVAPMGSKKIRVTQEREFTLVARNEHGTTERRLRVKTKRKKPVIREFVPHCFFNLVGDEVELSWKVSGAHKLYLVGIGNVTGKQRIRVPVQSRGKQRFELRAVNYFGDETSKFVTVNATRLKLMNALNRLSPLLNALMLSLSLS